MSWKTATYETSYEWISTLRAPLLAINRTTLVITAGSRIINDYTLNDIIALIAIIGSANSTNATAFQLVYNALAVGYKIKRRDNI